MWTPTHVIITVLRAKNLLEKGKGGNDAYCMIGLGKDKFLTSCKPKTTAPTWEEQAEFQLGEREDLKITVFHKSSIIDEFIGRVVINVAELAQDASHSHLAWYKLGSKGEKSDHKKAEKERGEIEVRVDFVIKPKAGSMMDLSMKNKEKSLSLRNLKEKSSNFKQSLKENLKLSLNKSRRSSKYAGENQLAEQFKKMGGGGGSKMDFLDGEDAASIASSYSSINGPNLNRSDSRQMNAMSRYNPARSSFISRGSSKMDNDSSSFADNTQNEDDFAEDNESNEYDAGLQFGRRNSSRFNRQTSRRSGLAQPGNNTEPTNDSNEQEGQITNDGPSIHIAPLPPFSNSTSTPTMQHRQFESNQKRHQVITSVIDEETSPNTNNKKNSPTSENSTIIESPQAKLQNTTSGFNSSTSPPPKKDPKQEEKIQVKPVEAQNKKQQAPTVPVVVVTAQPVKYPDSDDEEDHIDWASSEDEEIVKQEIEHFERNQVTTKTTETPNAHLSQQLEEKEDLLLFTDLFTDFTTTDAFNQASNKASSNLVNNDNDRQQLSKHARFPSPNKFSIEIDPFSSGSPTSEADPFSIFDSIDQFNNKMSEENENKLKSEIDFSKVDEITKSIVDNKLEEVKKNVENVKLEDEEEEEEEGVKKLLVDEAKTTEPVVNEESKKVNLRKEMNLSDDSDSEFDEEKVSVVVPKKNSIVPDKKEVLINDEKEENDENEDMEESFKKFSNEKPVGQLDDEMSGLEKELAEASLALQGATLTESNTDFDNELKKAFKNSDLNDSLASSTSTSSDDLSNDEIKEIKAPRSLFVDDANNKETKEEIETSEIKNSQQSSLTTTTNEVKKSNETAQLKIIEPFNNRTLRQSERRRLKPAEDLTSDLNSETDFNTSLNSSVRQHHNQANMKLNRNNMQIDLNNTQQQQQQNNQQRRSNQSFDDDIKTPDFDANYAFQDQIDESKTKSSGQPDANAVSAGRGSNNNGLPDLINQKGNRDIKPSDKAKKFLEGLDGVKFNEIQVPDTLKKQLEYFDRDDLLQLIAYQKKYIDYKESRIKDLENYIDNLIVKIIETEPLILMNTSNVLTKSRNPI